MQWFGSLPPFYVAIVAIAALVSTRKIVVAWLKRGEPLPPGSEAATLTRLDELRHHLALLQEQVGSLSDELAATRTEFRALARTHGAPVVALPPAQDGQDGTPAADAAVARASTLSS